MFQLDRRRTNGRCFSTQTREELTHFSHLFTAEVLSSSGAFFMATALSFSRSPWPVGPGLFE